MTAHEFYKIYNRQITSKIREALKEDDVNNDNTSKLLIALPVKEITAKLHCKENCMLAGLNIFKRVFLEVDNKVSVKQYYHDGQKVRANTMIAKISGSPYNLLRAERTALNFIQRMSGIATLTSEFVDLLKYKRATILHTRKTTPNFRLFEVLAVKIGGGDFHRLNIGSAVLIKDNHIKQAGSVETVLKRLKKEKLSGKAQGLNEIEVKSILELEKVIKYGKRVIKTIMLDNFPPSKLRHAMGLLSGHDFKAELSGGINLRNFRQLQHPGIDFYSIGMLTHSYKSIDLSFEF